MVVFPSPTTVGVVRGRESLPSVVVICARSAMVLASAATAWWTSSSYVAERGLRVRARDSNWWSTLVLIPSIYRVSINVHRSVWIKICWLDRGSLDVSTRGVVEEG